MSFRHFRFALILAYLGALGFKTIWGRLDDFYWYIAAYLVLGQITFWLQELAPKWELRRAAKLLSRLDPKDQRKFFDSVWPKRSTWDLEDATAKHGTPEVNGAIERFESSPIDRREAAIAFWCLIGIVAGIIGLSLVFAVPSVLQPLLIAVAVSVALLLVALYRRRIWLHTVVEISPFSLVQVDSNGGRRTSLSWNQLLVLENHTIGRHLLVTAPHSGQSVRIDYSMVGLGRLVSLVLKYGGFGGASQASEI